MRALFTLFAILTAVEAIHQARYAKSRRRMYAQIAELTR